jgi:hypothetical protein
VRKLVRIILPLAECKTPGGRKGATFETRHGALNGSSKPMVLMQAEALQAFQNAMKAGREAQAVLGLSGQPFQEALAINRCVASTSLTSVLERCPHAFVAAVTKPPLSAAAGRKLHHDVLFVCPLLGLLRPDDQVPDYRCPAGAQLSRFGSLHRFWKAAVTAALNRILKGAQVFSFLPTRLGALWKPDGREAGITVVRFSRLSGSRCVAETASVPRLSGEAVRYILENDVRSGSDLVRFRSSNGHAYRASHSRDDGPVRHLNFVLDPAGAPV